MTFISIMLPLIVWNNWLESTIPRSPVFHYNYCQQWISRVSTVSWDISGACQKASCCIFGLYWWYSWAVTSLGMLLVNTIKVRKHEEDTPTFYRKWGAHNQQIQPAHLGGGSRGNFANRHHLSVIHNFLQVNFYYTKYVPLPQPCWVYSFESVLFSMSLLLYFRVLPLSLSDPGYRDHGSQRCHGVADPYSHRTQLRMLRLKYLYRRIMEWESAETFIGGYGV